MTITANSNPSAATGAPADRTIPPTERVIWSSRPSLWIIPLRHAGWHFMMLLTLAAAWAANRSFLAAAFGGDFWPLFLGVWFTAVLARLAWDALDWNFRRYTLTDRRVIRESGVLRRLADDLPLDNIQHLSAYRSIRERLAGIGTVGMGTSGSALGELFWTFVTDHQDALARVRQAMSRPPGAGPETEPGPGSRGGSSRSPDAVARVFVVGLVGGIGSGKSSLAAALERLGCHVSNSDLVAREVLTRPAVRDRLVEWWGPGVVASDGSIDRAAVASIVFSSPAERTRLESLVHPLIKAQRAAEVESLRRRGGGISVIDAPLLFEAGIDRECDEIVFVDVPREARLERVARTRGWTEAELTRREGAQMPLEEKKARSHVVVSNAAAQEELELIAADLVARWNKQPA